jgi:hypothetical protein
MKRMAEEGEYVTRTGKSSTLFRYRWNSTGVSVSRSSYRFLDQSEIGAQDDKKKYQSLIWERMLQDTS